MFWFCKVCQYFIQNVNTTRITAPQGFSSMFFQSSLEPVDPEIWTLLYVVNMKVTWTLLHLLCSSTSTARPCSITDLQRLQHELTRTRPKCIAFIKLLLCIFPLTTFLSGFPHRLCRTVQKFDRSQGKADAVATWILRHAQQQELSISPNLQPRLTHFTSFGVSLVLNTFTTNIWSNISTVCYMKLCT